MPNTGYGPLVHFLTNENPEWWARRDLNPHQHRLKMRLSL